MGKLLPLRREFPKTRDVAARQQMAKEEFDLWTGYLESRKLALPDPDYRIEDKDLSLLRENFDRFKDRKTHGVKSEELVDFHHDFAKKFKFRVPLHPKNMQQMIHPHFGYLCNFHGRVFNFELLLEVYKNQIASSYERALGHDLHADELAALGYWLIEDSSNKGYFTLSELHPLLKAFRFDFGDNLTLPKFRSEFKFLLQQNPGEVRADSSEEEVVIRFDLVRQMFLERGL